MKCRARNMREPHHYCRRSGCSWWAAADSRWECTGVPGRGPSSSPPSPAVPSASSGAPSCLRLPVVSWWCPVPCPTFPSAPPPCSVSRSPSPWPTTAPGFVCPFGSLRWLPATFWSSVSRGRAEGRPELKFREIERFVDVLDPYCVKLLHSILKL